jgi:hypothetical protein
MTEYTRPATWDDVIALARALDAAGARYALIGGYAIAAHGYQRFTEDVDILVDPSPDNTPRWVEALSTLPDRAAEELRDDPEIFEREGHYAIRVNDELTVDIMPAACGHGWSELAPYAVRIEISGAGVSLSVLSLEGLLLTKEGMRDKDRADRAVLAKALGRDA